MMREIRSEVEGFEIEAPIKSVFAHLADESNVSLVAHHLTQLGFGDRAEQHRGDPTVFQLSAEPMKRVIITGQFGACVGTLSFDLESAGPSVTRISVAAQLQPPGSSTALFSIESADLSVALSLDLLEIQHRLEPA